MSGSDHKATTAYIRHYRIISAAKRRNGKRKIKVSAYTGACAHCLGPDDLPDGMMVGQCAQRNICGPDGKPIEDFGEAKMRLMQPGGNHVAITLQVLAAMQKKLLVSDPFNPFKFCINFECHSSLHARGCACASLV